MTGQQLALPTEPAAHLITLRSGYVMASPGKRPPPEHAGQVKVEPLFREAPTMVDLQQVDYEAAARELCSRYEGAELDGDTQR